VKFWNECRERVGHTYCDIVVMRWAWHNVTHLGFAVLACGQSEDSRSSKEQNAGGRGGAGGSSIEAPKVFPHCQQGILPVGKQLPDPRVRETHSGLNGEFTDSCEDGDLVQYDCETTTITGPPSDPATWTAATGQVVGSKIDCDGRCVNGACPNVCPAEGDQLHCLSVGADGHATFESISSGLSYACGIDTIAACDAMPRPGDTVDVIWTQGNIVLTGKECVAELRFGVGVGTQGLCWYYPCRATAP
jgi:hypothetical protein